MGELLAHVLAIGFAAALAPVPLLMVLVMLAGPQGLRRAWGFGFGFAASLLAAGAATLILTGEARTAFDRRALSLAGVAIGLAFLVMAARLARRWRSWGGIPTMNDRALLSFSDKSAAALGVVAGALNPKTLPIFLTGAVAIAAAEPPLPARAGALVLLTGIASMGVLLPPLVLVTAPGERTSQTLARVRESAERHAAVVAIALLAVTGVAYLVIGVTGLR